MYEGVATKIGVGDDRRVDILVTDTALGDGMNGF